MDDTHQGYLAGFFSFMDDTHQGYFAGVFLSWMTHIKDIWRGFFLLWMTHIKDIWRGVFPFMDDTHQGYLAGGFSRLELKDISVKCAELSLREKFVPSICKIKTSCILGNSTFFNVGFC